MRRIVFLIGLFLLLGSVVFYLAKFNLDRPVSVGADKVSIFASIYPLSFFAQQIGGEKVAVTTITPPGIEPHEYDPKPLDLAKIYGSDLLIVNGANMEPWADKIKPDLASKGINITTASENITLITKSGQPDPHIWLNPVIAKQIVVNIRDGLIRSDPSNEVYYNTNAQSLIDQLADLDSLYKNSLVNCLKDTIIASHSVFGYLENRYNFRQDTLAGLSLEEEPSARRISELVTVIKKNDIKYILTETLASPKLSETIAQETGAIIQIFNPLESLTLAESNHGQNYFSIQVSNIKILSTALQCTPQ